LVVLSHSPKLPRKGAVAVHSFVGPGYLNASEAREFDFSNGSVPPASRQYHFNDSTKNAAIRTSCYIEDNRRLHEDGRNLPAMLYLYQEQFPNNYRRIEDAVKNVVPQFEGFDLSPRRLGPENILLNWRQRHDDPLGPHQLSDGSLRAIALITLLLQPEKDFPDLLIIDEPELGLHPQALELISGLIRAAAVHTQVIVATQSESFLSHCDASEVIVVESGVDGSKFRRLSNEDLAIWLEDYSLGELWQRNVIGGGPIP